MTDHKAHAAGGEPLMPLRYKQHITQPTRQQSKKQHERDLIDRKNVIQRQKQQQKRLRHGSTALIVLPAEIQMRYARRREQDKKYDLQTLFLRFFIIPHKTFDSLGEYLSYALLREIRLSAHKDAGHSVGRGLSSGYTICKPCRR